MLLNLEVKIKIELGDILHEFPDYDPYENSSETWEKLSDEDKWKIVDIVRENLKEVYDDVYFDQIYEIAESAVGSIGD